MKNFNNILEIDGKKIGPHCPTFFIAEAGLNHNGDIKLAKKLIDEAKSSGASAVKFQTYITEKRVKKNSPIFDILKKCELSLKDFQLLGYAPQAQ